MSGAKKKADTASADMKQTDKKFDLSEDEGSQADDASSEAASLSTGASWEHVDSLSAALGMTDASVSAVADILGKLLEFVEEGKPAHEGLVLLDNMLLGVKTMNTDFDPSVSLLYFIDERHPWRAFAERWLGGDVDCPVFRGVEILESTKKKLNALTKNQREKVYKTFDPCSDDHRERPDSTLGYIIANLNTLNDRMMPNSIAYFPKEITTVDLIAEVCVLRKLIKQDRCKLTRPLIGEWKRNRSLRARLGYFGASHSRWPPPSSRTSLTTWKRWN